MFLHVYPHNTGAIALYERLGFRHRAELQLNVLRRLQPGEALEIKFLENGKFLSPRGMGGEFGMRRAGHHVCETGFG